MQDNSTDHQFANVLAARMLATSSAQAMDNGVTDTQVASCIEACRAAGIATMRQVASIIKAPSDTFIATQARDAADAALDDADLTAEDSPRLAAACAETWRRAFLCH
ncbi:MAG: hypothetical protein NTZ64_02840 [Polaromonas sp.]|nr:hypothetical protein [Polaromonas sp.]